MVMGPLRSTRLVPLEERWKSGCCGRPGASDILLPDVLRACWTVKGGCWKFPILLVRFIAEEGIGIADALWLMPPSVCGLSVSVSHCA